MSNLINNVRISNKAFFKKEEKLSFKNQGLLTGAFSFGAASLISACSNDSAGGGGGGGGGGGPPPPTPPGGTGVTYTSTVSLTTLEEPDSLEGGTETGITWSTEKKTDIGPKEVHGLTMTVALNDNDKIIWNNVAYRSKDVLASDPTAKIYNEIDGDNTGKDILFYSSAFYKEEPFSITPTENSSYHGGVTILWDIPTVAGTVSLSDLKYLHISGHESQSLIRDWSPQMLKINTGDDYDLMVAASKADFADGRDDAGAIHIFWDIAQYKSRPTDAVEGKVSISTDNTGENFLSIYGASSGDQIKAPQLFKLKDANYDLIFSSAVVDDKVADVGAIYILWDVAHSSYSSDRKIIDLAASSGDNYASQGLLTIYGNSKNDLLQLTKDVTHFHHVDNNTNFDFVVYNKDERITDDNGGIKVAGAIYILWDIGSYASTKHQKIILDPDNSASATYGLFSIIGESVDGLNDKFSYGLLTKTSMDDSIAKDLNKGGKKDIAFKYDSKTYVIFGEVMAETNNLNIIKSKTIDLADVTETDGYFDYTFDSVEVKNVGYVFNSSYSYLDAIPDIPVPTNLSETFESHDYWIA